MSFLSLPEDSLSTTTSHYKASLHPQTPRGLRNMNHMRNKSSLSFPITVFYGMFLPAVVIVVVIIAGGKWCCATV